MSVWFRLERIEEELSRRGSPFGRRTHDSYGRLLDGLRAPWNFGLDTRVQRLRRALRDSRHVAESLIKERLAGIDLGIVWATLIETCEDVALYYGASVVAGAAVGGVAGAFAGGVGAIPGAAAGAATGATVGGWILALLGLKATVEGLVDAVPAALGYYGRGFRVAWGPTPRERMSPTSYLLSPTSAQVPEFDRQLAGQERGVNGMSVQEYLDGRAAFDTGLNARDPGVARQAREAYQEKLVDESFARLQKAGLPPREAKAKAADMASEQMRTLAALHNPDMVAGGKDVIGDFGDRNVNSRIGAQWRSRVGELDTAASGVPASDRMHTKMNAKLE